MAYGDDGSSAGRTVTFRTEPGQDGDEAYVVGDFNEWSLSATPMRRVGDHFEATVRLDLGRAYRYRFLFDGHRWENDWHAQRYQPNAFGGEDSVIDLTATATATSSSDPNPTLQPGGTVGKRRR